MKILAFEDSVDIEALLISGGVELSSFEFKQYWDSKNYLEIILNSLRHSDVRPLHATYTRSRRTQGITRIRSQRPKTIIAIVQQAWQTTLWSMLALTLES